MPTPTPTLTPVAAENTAVIGENRGAVETGGGQVWTYEGQEGEVLTISAVADWDTTLTLQEGAVVLASNDDGEGLSNYNSRITLTLPADSTYQIEVRSYNNESGGPYTLVIESSRTGGGTPTPTP